MRLNLEDRKGILEKNFLTLGKTYLLLKNFSPEPEIDFRIKHKIYPVFPSKRFYFDIETNFKMSLPFRVE